MEHIGQTSFQQWTSAENRHDDVRHTTLLTGILNAMSQTN